MINEKRVAGEQTYGQDLFLFFWVFGNVEKSGKFDNFLAFTKSLLRYTVGGLSNK